MTRPTDPLFDQRIADWLEGDPVHAPDQVLEIVLAALPSIPRRRASGVPWRFIAMPISVRWPVAAAAAAVVLVVGVAMYVNRPNQPAIGGPSTMPGVSASPSASLPGPSTSVVPARAAAWSATGSMTTARGGFSTTLLRDGRVLVAGGDELVEGVDTASAEVFDPDSATWTATGSMATPRSGHTATLLPDGRVLVAGGGRQADQYTRLASAELYDPRTGSWSATGKMAAPRSGATATLLPDGRVLVTGGKKTFGGSERGTASAEIYDPGTGTWIPTASMLTEHFGHSATLLRDGTVLVAGGACCGATPEPVATVELYDPGSGTWTATHSMGQPRVGLTATLLLDGNVLVTGGYDPGRGQLASAELYDPSPGTWTSTATMGTTGMGFSATLLLDGRVLAAGGYDFHADVSGYGAPLATAELYDPGSGTWTATVAMLRPSADVGATLLQDGRVLVFVVGGDRNGTSVELYDPGSG
jgi:hypothetical protein